MLPAGGFAEPFGIVKSSRKVASPRACKSPMATVFDDQRSAKTPRRQILPLAKFPCLRAFSTLWQSVDFVNILPGIENAGLARRFSLVIPPRQQGFSSSAVGKRRFPCGSSLRWKYHPPACHPEFFNGRPTKPGKPVGSLREYLWGTP